MRRPVAVVTGGRRGIGAAVALELAEHGFDLAITDIESSGADETLAAIQKVGAQAKLFAFDLASIEQHATALSSILEWGGAITCLVNNAGISSPQRGDLFDVSPSTYDRVQNVNLRGTFFWTQAVARHMLSMESAHPRSIVVISSVSSEAVSIERAEYCLSKASLPMLTKLFALRLAPHNIGVFEVRPGLIYTPMTAAFAERFERLMADGLVPVGRWGYPGDVARAVSALVGGRLAFATGSTINVDGALSISRL